MTEALFMMGGLGLIVGVGLAAASKIFYVYIDPKILAVDDALPGANCGGCGLPGCGANAEAIVAGKAAVNSCVAAGAEVAEAIASIMGVAIEAKEPDIARPGCTYGVAEADTHYLYNGLKDCRAVALMGGGMKVCRIGCLGMGTCAKACPFDAITMGDQGLPVVDQQRCTGCGTCERVCPKNIINLSSVTRRILREYTTDECTTPCQRTCPAGIDIRMYIHHVASGDYHKAVEVIKERNPFPAVIGRICPRPCETECRRKYVDEPVAINFLKRYAADFEIESGERVFPYKAPESGRKIAVVGGGAQGLSAAFFSTRLGHSISVFEATSEMGGLLRSAISAYRLPRDILDWDIEGVAEMGVDMKTEQVFGKDVTIASLLSDGYHAILVTSGGWDSRLARNGASTVEPSVPDVYLLVDLLRFKSAGWNESSIQSNVVIYGGDRLSLKAARILKEMGAKEITVLSRESKSDMKEADGWMDELEQEGIHLIYGTGIHRLFGEGNRLTEIETIDLKSGSMQRLAAGSVIIASGRFPEMIIVQATPESESQVVPDEPAADDAPLYRWEGLAPYKKPTFRDAMGFLAEGDSLSDFSAAIKAIGAGRRIAASIHQMMYGITPILSENVVTRGSEVQNVDRVESVLSAKRHIMPLATELEVQRDREIEKGFTQEMARAEADRCLQCGLICYKQNADSERETERASGF